jgi:hypothetical protein
MLPDSQKDGRTQPSPYSTRTEQADTVSSDVKDSNSIIAIIRQSGQGFHENLKKRLG